MDLHWILSFFRVDLARIGLRPGTEKDCLVEYWRLPEPLLGNYTFYMYFMQKLQQLQPDDWNTVQPKCAFFKGWNWGPERGETWPEVTQCTEGRMGIKTQGWRRSTQDPPQIQPVTKACVSRRPGCGKVWSWGGRGGGIWVLVTCNRCSGQVHEGLGGAWVWSPVAGFACWVVKEGGSGGHAWLWLVTAKQMVLRLAGRRCGLLELLRNTHSWDNILKTSPWQEWGFRSFRIKEGEFRL